LQFGVLVRDPADCKPAIRRGAPQPKLESTGSSTRLRFAFARQARLRFASA
jgi:hypothetical protein